MAALKQKIQEELISALKEKNKIARSVLGFLSAAILSKEKEKRYKIFSLREIPRRGTKQKPDLNEEGLIKESQLTDEEILDVISSEIKKRKDSVAAYEMGKREDLAKKEKAEIEILQKYLPEQISEEEIRKLVKEAIEKVGAREVKDMGRVMAELMPKVKGKADGSMVSKIVKELLSKGD